MAAANEPKYRMIKKALLEEVRQGDYLPGHSFITEREVCRNFGVSRITAIRALNDLVDEGVLVRKQGKGTFVAGPPELPNDGRDNLIGCVFHEIHATT